jgi:hypothetical protein
MRVANKAVVPPVRWTTPDPAKSTDPAFRKGDTLVILKKPLLDQTEWATTG